MDLYKNNTTTLRRLLNKRQNPCNQVFKSQSSNSTSDPMSAMDLARNGAFTNHEEQLPDLIIQSPAITINPPNKNSQPQSQSHSVQFSSSPHPTVNSPSQMEEDDDNEPAPERVQKKIKTSMISTYELKSQRRFSEERDESEHSTACETHSEFNAPNEAGDFLLSPSTSPYYSNDSSEFKSNDHEETPIQSGLIHLNVDSDGETLTSKMPEETIQQTTENASIGSKIKVRCKLNHQWEMETGPDSRKTCPRCEELLGECKEFAKKNEGTCLNQEYEETIRYQCIKGHCWNLNYKNARRRWCAQCAKEQRNFLKRKCEEEKMEREKQEEECQKKLFEEARKKAASESGSQSSKPLGINKGCDSQKGKNSLEYFQRIDYEIETLAKKYTISFMSQKDFAGNANYQQILQVYKIMIMPEEILQTYMFNLNADTLRSEFRRMAKIIHPDKNKHPLAGNAFLKIYKVYETALSRLEGAQQKI